MAKTITNNPARKNGNQYYNFLRQTLIAGQQISTKNHFVKWLRDEDLQFTIPNNNPKAITKDIIIKARNSFLAGNAINNKWLISNGCNRGWCLADALNGLFQMYP